MWSPHCINGLLLGFFRFFNLYIAWGSWNREAALQIQLHQGWGEMAYLFCQRVCTKFYIVIWPSAPFCKSLLPTCPDVRWCSVLSRKISHLSLLEFTVFLLIHSSVFFRYLWMAALISSTLAIPPSLALLTDVTIMYYVSYSKLLMRRLNSVSSSTYPSMAFMSHYQLRLQNHDLCPVSQRAVLWVFHSPCSPPTQSLFLQFY